MLGGISIWQLLILLVIVVMVFGTKKLRNVGGDLGSALKDFRTAMKDGEQEESDKQTADDATRSEQARVIDQEPEENAQQTDDAASHDHTS